MSGLIDATPCPGGLPLGNRRPRDSITSIGGESTAEIDFTTEFRASLLATKPRRRQTNIGLKRQSGGAYFTIHEDQELASCPNAGNRNVPNTKPSLLRKPALRGKVRASIVPSNLGSIAEHLAPVPRPENPRVDFGTEPSLPTSSLQLSEPYDESKGKRFPANIRKPARRGTIWIPPDDTTMPSIHMGIFSPIKNLHHEKILGGGEATTDFTGLAVQIAKKRGRRESLAAAPAKRIPLHRSSMLAQPAATEKERPGRKTGKENLPPGHHILAANKRGDETKLFDLSNPSISSQSHLYPEPSKQPPAFLRVSGAQSDVNANSQTHLTGLRKEAYSIWPPKTSDQLSQLRLYQSRPASRSISVDTPNARPQKTLAVVSCSSVPQKLDTAPSKLSVIEIPKIEPQKFRLLAEDISEPSMYEESWLSHQEVAITQLVNALFTRAQGPQSKPDPHMLRRNVLEVYQDTSFPLLHKRLQASLLYGALSVPTEILSRSLRLWTDLGLRERFCSFWLDTYDLRYLVAGLEVVVGRECSAPPRSDPPGNPPGNSTDDRALRKAARLYLESILIRNEDADPEDASVDRAGWSYRRTLLRSFMLIKLLDNAKTSPESALGECLFVPTSVHKSSTSVVQALTQMLNPGVGDVLRRLNYLDYCVNYKQYPLEEYDYHVENLAIDLRDGIKLTRLVELLLYPSASNLRGQIRDDGATTTVAMPTGEILSLLEGENDWPLSQHLKVPCLGKATKLYNVQLALSALSGVEEMQRITRGICAEDVVNGHREKTVALLWSLAGKWGLGGLVDWDDLNFEIRRLHRGNTGGEDADFDDLKDDFRRNRRLLKAWASAVAHSNGLQVSNLTTSFSDGRVFRCIVGEYQQYLPGGAGDDTANLPLKHRLALLGCSNQFADLFTSQDCHGLGRIYDRDFTIAALAFLSSRLLSTTRRTRMAITIQRFWRRYQDCLHEGRREVARRLAGEAQAVVSARQRVLWAKEVIWRAWKDRGMQRRRMSRRTDPVASPCSEESIGDVWLSL